MNEKDYKIVLEDDYPKSNWDIFKQIVKRSVKGDLFIGLKITLGIFYRNLFNSLCIF